MIKRYNKKKSTIKSQRKSIKLTKYSKRWLSSYLTDDTRTWRSNRWTQPIHSAKEWMSCLGWRPSRTRGIIDFSIKKGIIVERKAVYACHVASPSLLAFFVHTHTHTPLWLPLAHDTSYFPFSPAFPAVFARFKISSLSLSANFARFWGSSLPFYTMNIFRFAGDMTHLISILVLLLKIYATKSCSGNHFLSHSHFLPLTRSFPWKTRQNWNTVQCQLIFPMAIQCEKLNSGMPIACTGFCWKKRRFLGWSGS